MDENQENQLVIKDQKITKISNLTKELDRLEKQINLMGELLNEFYKKSIEVDEEVNKIVIQTQFTQLFQRKSFISEENEIDMFEDSQGRKYNLNYFFIFDEEMNLSTLQFILDSLKSKKESVKNKLSEICNF